MGRKFSLPEDYFSNRHQRLTEIDAHHQDVVEALKLYLQSRDLLNKRLAELERTSIFSILSAIEAAFRRDYLIRCDRKNRNKYELISQEFQNIYNNKENKWERAHLEIDILSTWKKMSTVDAHLISALKDSFKYRHWLAHGRYWKPNLGRRNYSYEYIYELAQTVFSSFPLKGGKYW